MIPRSIDADRACRVCGSAFFRQLGLQVVGDNGRYGREVGEEVVLAIRTSQGPPNGEGIGRSVAKLSPQIVQGICTGSVYGFADFRKSTDKQRHNRGHFCTHSNICLGLGFDSCRIMQ